MGVELIMGMEEVINYLKELEAENKKLKEENKKLKEPMNEELEDYLEMNGAVGGIMKTQTERDFYKKKVVELQEQIECVKRQIESVCKVNDELKEQNKILKEEIEWKNIAIRKEVNRNKELQEENKKLDKMIKYLPNDMEDKWWCEKNEKWRWEGDGYLSEIDDEEEEDKYENDPEWRKAYGFTVKRGEYRICVAGGGDHWEDYVITKNKCFIENSKGRINVNTFISHGETNHIKDIPLGVDMYILEDGETDMKEFIQENYEEEIMNYVETDEDDYEEPDSP